jgi:hypothetical protein
VKWEPPVPAELAGIAKGLFPSFLKKTDEERIQNLASEYEELKEQEYYVTEKLDGSSATYYYKDGEFGVCSRNLELLETEGNTFWKVAREMNLEEKMKSLNRNLCFQGELIGESVQGNPYKIKGQTVKFFNVYGPGEDHKGAMISVVKLKLEEARAGRPPRLFRSHTPGIADGAQRRDFIWVGDVVDVMLWLLDTPKASGLFNLGTGTARTYLNVAEAACRAAGLAPGAEFIDMPEPLRAHYQNFTEAPMARLRAAGYAGQFTPLEEGVAR